MVALINTKTSKVALRAMVTSCSYGFVAIKANIFLCIICIEFFSAVHGIEYLFDGMPIGIKKIRVRYIVLR